MDHKINYLVFFQLHLNYKTTVHMLFMHAMLLFLHHTKITNHSIFFFFTEIISNNLNKTTFKMHVGLE